MTLASRLVLVLLVAAVLLTPMNMFSCGPFWEGPTFVRKDAPDKPAKNFVDGELGILWPDFEREYLVIAYRYLIDKPLTAIEKDSRVKASGPNIVEMPKDWHSNGPFDPVIYQWLKARSTALGLPQVQQLDIQRYKSTDYFNAYPNCGDDAFINAAAIAQKRGKTFGIGDPRVRDWVAGQDVVFQNCGDSKFEYTGYDQKKPAPPLHMPAPPSVEDAVLKRDRNYQIAAAYFYAGQFDAAMQQYETIARDQDSPWNQLARYLTARCYIRKSTIGAAGESSFSPEPMQLAEAQLQSILKSASLAKLHHPAARRLLNYVEARLHPDERIHAIALDFNGGTQTEDFNRNLEDFNWLLTRQVDRLDVPQAVAEDRTKEVNPQESPEEAKAAAWRRRAEHASTYDDLTDWVITFRPADTQSIEYSFQRWQATRSLPWLISALVGAHITDPHAAEIQSAAKLIGTNSPAYTTALYHRARLLLEESDQQAARKLLDSNMPLIKASSPSDRNAFFAQRMAVASNFEDFLRFAPRTPIDLIDNIGKYSYSCQDGTCYSSTQAPSIKAPQRLDADSVKVFNLGLPLSMLVQASEGTVLPGQLRDKLAMTTWLRAGMVDDTATARQLQGHVLANHPNLGSYLQAYEEADSSQARRFALVFMAMHYPEMQPFINVGPLGSIDISGISSGSWWCSDMGTGQNMDNSIMPLEVKQTWRNPSDGQLSAEPLSYPSFLTRAERTRAKWEWEHILSTKAAPFFFAESVLPWAESHPQDPRVPEALHLFVRSTRYRCADKTIGKSSKQAFELLHRRYADSPWTKKTKYWFD